ncbi:MAG TPA: DUF4231 domain-containing protein [Streptosporangiaceae bacterium]|nr:DUF4231 domain-containing protein [Streptosporangiaceae bacterium]
MSEPVGASALGKELNGAGMPAVHKVAGTTSGKSQREYLLWTRVRLYFVILAAAAGAWAAAADKPPGWHKALAAIAVACFVVALSAEVLLLTRRPEELWYHSRAIAESSKTLAWRYAMRANPFSAAETEAEADARMNQRLQDLLTQSPIAGKLPPPAGENITETMRVLRGAALEERKQAYLNGRVDDQRKWYAKKANDNSRGAKLWRTLLILFELAGALWAIFVLAGFTTVVLDGLLASMVAGAGAWLEVKQFENLADAYNLTATELGFVYDAAKQVADEAGWSAYVNSAEQAISREHTMWLARRVNLNPQAEPQ